MNFKWSKEYFFKLFYIVLSQIEISLDESSLGSEQSGERTDSMTGFPDGHNESSFSVLNHLMLAKNCNYVKNNKEKGCFLLAVLFTSDFILLSSKLCIRIINQSLGSS